METKNILMGIFLIGILGIFAYSQFSAPKIQQYKMDVPFNLNEEAKTASSDKPTDVELTIYQVEPSYYYYAAANGFDINNGLALIKEMRLANLPGGLTKFQMKGTAQYLDSTSLHLKDLTDGTTQVLEQNYQYDLVSNQKLMENYIGKEIEVVTSDGKGGK